MTGLINGVTPFSYAALISSSFGIAPPTGIIGPFDAVVANPVLATSPPTNGSALQGKIALVERGSNAFVDKANNVQTATAGNLSKAMVVVNSIPGQPPIIMSGTNPSVTIPSFMISFDDGINLLNATSVTNVVLTSNTPGTRYSPPTGSNYGAVTFIGGTAGSTSLGIVVDASGVVADANIQPASPFSENPAFGPYDPNFPLASLGLVIGDQVILSQNNVTDAFNSNFGNANRQVLTIIGFGATAGSFQNNQLFFDQALLFDADDGTSLTLLPNVRIVGTSQYSWDSCSSTGAHP